MPKKRQGRVAENAARDSITWTVLTGVIGPDVRRLFTPVLYLPPLFSAVFRRHSTHGYYGVKRVA